MKITGLKCAEIGRHPIVRITTDEGIDGFGQVEWTKPYLIPAIRMLEASLIGHDPTNVERVVKTIRHRGAFKPWGAVVSAIEIALWDIAGKAAGVPVYKLLGGKVRDRVKAYNGSYRTPPAGSGPDDYARHAVELASQPQGFDIIKLGVAYHSQMPLQVPNFHYGEANDSAARYSYPHRGLLTERGFTHLVECAGAVKAAVGPGVGVALDCGPGWTLPDAIRFAKAVEHLNLLWLEDMITGDYSPFVNADVYRELTRSSSTPIHTGEQIYLRQNFKELIEGHAVNVVGPDPVDVGGLAELKWVAEYADLHGILMAPHGTADGLLGLAALVQVSATLPDNYIAFEAPGPATEWWPEIVDGVPAIEGGYCVVPDRPGLGVTFNDRARHYLGEEDAGFFD
ncbi:MAG TPA: mandelate racemase/muconate lactonizing enzyme family protein [Thermomicrobiales bacterium]|nr:mandelate racemase/muconate lactonizing enzyme family protein [Thermomicrobiales bacterium]